MTRFCLLAILSAVAFAETPSRTPLLPRAREIELATSAAPPAVADNATIYVLEAAGYVKVRDGNNGYSCLVSRTDHPLDLTPVCHDRNGTETVLPPALVRAEMRARGAGEAEIRAAIAEGFRTGKFRSPKPGGISYMLSTEGYTYDAATATKKKVPPHVMVYAPYTTNADLGIPVARLNEIYQAGMPFLRGEGEPDAYIIILMPSWKPSDPHTGH
jgi:hypothetical protein